MKHELRRYRYLPTDSKRQRAPAAKSHSPSRETWCASAIEGSAVPPKLTAYESQSDIGTDARNGVYVAENNVEITARRMCAFTPRTGS